MYIVEWYDCLKGWCYINCYERYYDACDKRDEIKCRSAKLLSIRYEKIEN